ncbi:MAG: hypothetical protein RI947_897 [Candidatus Parcubacteria bacterium]
MKTRRFIYASILIILAAIGGLVYIFLPRNSTSVVPPITITEPTVVPTVPVTNAPDRKILSNDYHVYQSFNNCGPASLSMMLSYLGVKESQEALGDALRPYQHPQGDNDDKSVTLDELARKAEEYGFIAFHRPNGNIRMIKQFIAADIPVLTRTWLKEGEDIGHYRVVKGYDDTNGELVQDDSLQGKNLKYTYAQFNAIWDKFNYEYVVFVPKEKAKEVRQILGDEADEPTSWANAAKRSRELLTQDPDNIYNRFNLSVALYHTADYNGSVSEFERVETRLPKRTLWYQIEPIQAYAALNNVERVLSITESILSNQNRAFSELYIIRGDMYLKQGDKEAARGEYQKAVEYNRNLKEAQNRLASVGE